ncbi:MAG: hypothetical protein RBG1_1C00001G1250 [candidate division Zixibacteria bacterium RBG-1]|nr:MAG: hypothetical protein RBG1_1C00001G1250 [candidate division Zixibacteria bacterium RBG-1]OGC84251.1 MAG: hypothetical protein A2V73_05260 [candidate division Zixibacteria bacterium RBG_19FT_COMBO_42_43]
MIEGLPKYKILLVCTGNTCRSPMAEGILKQMLKEKNISHIEVNSAGVGASTGAPATPFSIDTTKSFNIDITNHKARKVDPQILRESDLILVMAPEHYFYIQQLDSGLSPKIYLLKAFPSREMDDKYTIKDPLGGDEQVYQKCFYELEEQLRRIWPTILDWSLRKGQLK